MSDLLEYRDIARDEWIDYNGHLSEPFYVMVFGLATTAMMDAVGIDEDYRSSTGSSLYTVEAHVRYLHEVPAGAELVVTTSVISVQGKKLRFAHELHVEGRLAATEELLALHVTGSAASPFPPAIVSKLEEHLRPAPDYAGRSIYG